jgi:hypothetical protein
MSKYPLGFSTCCHQEGLPLVRGTIASIRAFAPDAPICLFTDGDFDVHRLVRAYDLIHIPRNAIKSPELRSRSFGYLTKMLVHWEAPFERVIHVDCDAVLWGDIRLNLPQGDWDYVYNEPHEIITPEIMKGQYFDPASPALRSVLDSFSWQDRPFFNAGVFACRVGAFSFDEYMRYVDLFEQSPRSFPTVDQSIQNLMVFSGLEAGSLNVKQAHLQTVVPVCDPRELEQRFQFRNGKPVLNGIPTVIHWAGPKPYLLTKHPFSRPMTYFRTKALRKSGVPSFISPATALFLDEMRCRQLPRYKRNLVSSLKRAIRRFRA